MTEEERLIREEVARFLDGNGGLEAAMQAADGKLPDALWADFAGELGMAGVAIPEENGGLGLGMGALTAISAEIGQRLAPMPWTTVVGRAAALLVHGCSGPLRDDWLGRIAGGAGVATVVTAAGLDIVQNGDEYFVSGCLSGVSEGVCAGLFLILDGDAVFAVEAGAAVAAGALPVLDATRPMAQVTFSDASAVRIGSGAGVERGLACAKLAEAAETVGAARGALDVTRAYIAERQQFGRTIASYQAIKHRVADLFARLVVAESMVRGLAGAMDGGGADADARLEAEAALALASQLLDAVSAEAIQLHGGVGFTWEYTPHLFFKRALAVRAGIGGGEAIFTRIGAALMGGQVAALASAGEDSPLAREVSDWLAQHLTGRFAPLVGRGGAGDGEALPDLRKKWEAELARGGWVGLGLSEADGGRGMSVADQVTFNEVYARAGGPGRMGHIGEGLIGPTIARWGTDAQKKRHLPGILAGTVFWAQGFSEPSAGSDLAGVRTRARFDEASGTWRVSGQKIWTSLAHMSDWIFVIARAVEGSVGRAGLVFLLMPLDQPGISIRPIRQINGGAEFNEVFFDEAEARGDDMLGEVGQGWEVAMDLLGHERGISTLGQQLGFARELEAVARLVAAGPERPGLTARLGRAWAGLRAMRYGALRNLSAMEDGSGGVELMTYKYEWSNWHRDLGELAMEALGRAAAHWSDDPGIAALQHMFLFSRSETIYGGTNEIQLNIISERGLGMPREPRGA